jgi:hypothetical protein
MSCILPLIGNTSVEYAIEAIKVNPISSLNHFVASDLVDPAGLYHTRNPNTSWGGPWSGKTRAVTAP